MTPPIADKTPIPAKIWRRHTDPPGLWVAVIMGSISLHLLVFWLMRSSGFSLRQQQNDEATIPIEIVEIPAQTQPRAKPVPSKPLSTTQKPQVTAKATFEPEDRSAIDFTKRQQAIAEQRQRELTEQRQRELTEQRQRELDEQRQRELDEQRQRELDEQRQRELDEQRQRELTEQRQRELDEQRQRELDEQRQRELDEQRQRELDEQRQRELTEQRQRELDEQRQRELDEQHQRELDEQANNQNLSSETPGNLPGIPNTQDSSLQTSNADAGSLLASLVGEPQQLERDRHNHPAKIKPSNQPFPKGLEYVKYIEKKPGQPLELTVILTISEKGELEKVAIEDEAIPVDQRSYYQDFITNQVFQNWEFEPAYDNDPNDPKPSDLMVRIQIQPLP
ncbi:MAG: hypothetical protein KME21_17820 [Desmonostoc vinosum HA7617-LM4]|jgi:colicin import membrane protein|nr:hypothetical protein [Desmonostoc vinosum HA7617-LM4]